MTTRSSRLARVRLAIDDSPVRHEILKQAYGWFVDFGELPEDDHVAFEVVQQALRGGEEAPPLGEAELAQLVQGARNDYQSGQRPQDTWPPSVRAFLFDEALFEAEPVRGLARAAIAREVALGGDVESVAFAARHGIPTYGSVGMHVVEASRRLAVPPYEAQAAQLFVRMDNLHGRTPHGDRRWVASVGQAVSEFLQSGTLPSDELPLEMVLIEVEIRQLVAHRSGRDVTQAMVILAEAVHAEGKKLQWCLDQLSELARTGKL